MKLTLTLLAALAAAGPALAGPDRYSVLLTSLHTEPRYEVVERNVPIWGEYEVSQEINYNEINPGLFATWEMDGYDITVGGYVNSYAKLSAAAFVAVPLYRTEDFSFDVFAGAATYFDTIDGPIRPMGGVQARYRNVFVQLMPGGVLAAGVTF